MTLTSVRRLDAGVVTILDTVETVMTEFDDGTFGNIEYALVANEGDIDTQWTFTEALEHPNDLNGIDLMDTFTFESLDEDGGYRHFRVKGEFTGIDAGIISPEEAVDNPVVCVIVNGVIVDTSETFDINEGAGVANFDTIVTVKDGDVLQFPVRNQTAQAIEWDMTFEVDEAAILIT